MRQNDQKWATFGIFEGLIFSEAGQIEDQNLDFQF